MRGDRRSGCVAPTAMIRRPPTVLSLTKQDVDELRDVKGAPAPKKESSADGEQHQDKNGERKDQRTSASR